MRSLLRDDAPKEQSTRRGQRTVLASAVRRGAGYVRSGTGRVRVLHWGGRLGEAHADYGSDFAHVRTSSRDSGLVYRAC